MLVDIAVHSHAAAAKNVSNTTYGDKLLKIIK